MSIYVYKMLVILLLKLPKFPSVWILKECYPSEVILKTKLLVIVPARIIIYTLNTHYDACYFVSYYKYIKLDDVYCVLSIYIYH